MLDEITPQVLASVRLDKARGCLQDAIRELTANSKSSLRTAANRSYYCIFHAMRAVLALEQFDSKKHSGVISEFNKNYVKTKIFPELLKDILNASFKIRNDSDYNDFYLISKDDVSAQIENAKTFLTAIEEYISRVAPEVMTVNTNIDGENNDDGGMQ